VDVIFVHSPSFFDFRNQILVTGALTDGIPNSAIYEMYPMGFFSMASALQQAGFRVRILNLALKMLKHSSINVERYIKSLDANIFAFDLHWMIHALGAIEISRLFKRVHPNSTIMFGGFTSSYFALELMQKYPHIDMVLRGDTVEPLLPNLVQNVNNPVALQSVPNLVWRNKGKIVENPFSFVPKSFDYVNSEFFFTLAKMILQSGDFDPNGFLPSAFYSKKPVLPVLFSKGCTHNCINCGGSQYAMKKVCNRERIALKPPAVLVSEILDLSSSFNLPIRLIGDLQIASTSYKTKVFDLLKRHLSGKVKNYFHFEFFKPPSGEYLHQLGEIFEDFFLELSPETGNDIVRRKQGRPFTNTQILQSSKDALEMGHSPLIYWFQTGNGFETLETLKETQHLCGQLLKLNPTGVFPFISPLNPYIDPGSIAFEHPEENGYHLLYPDLETQIEGFKKPIWKYYLNYETQNFSRDDLVRMSYDQAIQLNDLRTKYGALDSAECENLNRVLRLAYRVLSFLDKDTPVTSQSLPKIRHYLMEGGQVQLKKKQTRVTLEGGENLLSLLHSGITLLSYKIKKWSK